MKKYRYPRESRKCGRSLTGDSCASGPIGAKCGERLQGNSDQACTPLRTLHWWNQTIQVALTLMALVGVSVACSSLGIKHTLAPGPLSTPHAQLLVATHRAGQANTIDESNRCAACHPGMDSSSAVFANENSHSQSLHTQSQLCLKCHEKNMPDAIHGSPHDLTGSSLHELLNRYEESSSKEKSGHWLGSPVNALRGFLASKKGTITWQNHSTECSQCHREHQGAMHTLQSMASDRCQACHRTQFESFSKGHPEFKDYPYDRPKNIAFDHQKHSEMHFAKKNALFDCKACHLQTDQIGVVGQVFRTVSFERGCASCHAEPMRTASHDGLIVLQVPSIHRDALKRAGVDIGKWPDEASQMTEGAIPPIMRALLQNEPGGPELLAKLPANGRLDDLDMPQALSQALLAELAKLTKQLTRRLANDGQPVFRSAVEHLVVAKGTQSKLVSTHKESPWLDRFASGIPPDLFRTAMQEWFSETPGTSNVVDQRAFNNQTIRLTSQSQSPNASDDLLSGGSDDLLGPSSSSLLTPNDSRKSDAKFKETKAWDQLGYGGWMIDRQRMAIVYVPRGHADEWLSQWLELESFQNQASVVSGTPTLESSSGIAKQCRQCHTLQSDSGVLPNYVRQHQVNFKLPKPSEWTTEQFLARDNANECWRAMQRLAKSTPITKFDHTPHLVLPTLQDCQSCHHLLRSDTSHSTAGVTREFAPMQRSQCISCHQPNAAGESCTQCHNYHVGEKSWTSR